LAGGRMEPAAAGAVPFPVGANVPAREAGNVPARKGEDVPARDRKGESSRPPAVVLKKSLLFIMTPVG
ncbi:MAG TPA: hypothetical protein VD772_00320, partial [Anseongella sp.]|nr:hypothetical protein [Anseongella sp.]